MKSLLRLLLVAVVVASAVGFAVLFTDHTRGAVVVGEGLNVAQDGDISILSADGIGEVVRTAVPISHAQMFSYPDSATKTVTWTAGGENFYAVSLDGTTIALSTPAD